MLCIAMTRTFSFILKVNTSKFMKRFMTRKRMRAISVMIDVTDDTIDATVKDIVIIIEAS